MQINKKTIGRLLGPIVFFLILNFFHPEGLSDSANAILASVAWMVIWWVTEALPIPVTALLPLVLFPLSGGLKLTTTSAAYGHKFIFLFLGGFILAIAIEKWNLHKRIALTIIQAVGTSVVNIILGFMLATAFLSMWISNTATSVMMLPIGLAIVTQLKDNPDTIEDENKVFGKALMLAIGYSATIGGISTLIGTPPNLVFAGVFNELFNIEITFSQWIVFGLPISILLLFICWVYLTRFGFTFKQTEFPGGRAEIKRQLQALGKLSFEEKLVATVFVFTALAWILRSFVLKDIFPGIDDTIIAIFSAIILFILPSQKRNEPLLTWEDAVKLPWGILILFGGGMAIAAGFAGSGLAEWLGSQMQLLKDVPLLVLIFLLVLFVNLITEVTSNMALTAMILPVLAPLALVLDVHPYLLMVGATAASSCAFMLPISTPPNAVIFGSGFLKIPDMVKTGFWLNIVSVILIALVTYFLLPLFWDFDSTTFPNALKQMIK